MRMPVPMFSATRSFIVDSIVFFFFFSLLLLSFKIEFEKKIIGFGVTKCYLNSNDSDKINMYSLQIF